MTLHVWLAFLLAATIVLVIPGPTVLLVIGQSLGMGRRGALPIVAGVALGDLTAMSLSLGGLGALLAASAAAFAALKWAGAAYLVWLGLRLWRAPVAADVEPPLPARAAFWQAYVVTALNPKGIAFFVAFAPQFIVAGAPFAPQAAILTLSFVALAAVNCLAYALLAGRLSSLVRRAPVRRAFNRAGGGVLIGAGAALGFRS